ncbi:TPA: hypothetical protein U5E22_003512 [Yersinia enterocolitica]|nr:hypothetical protein [Yersinia enterocolitica]
MTEKNRRKTTISVIVAGSLDAASAQKPERTLGTRGFLALPKFKMANKIALL